MLGDELSQSRATAAAPPRSDVTPTVSAVIFAHDHELFVAKCIESMLMQSLPGSELEIVIIDDASSDRTWEVVERYADEARVTSLIRHSANTGAPRTYVDGMAAARGQYLVPMDADDWATSADAVALELDTLQRCKDAAFVHTAYEVVDAHGGPLRTERAGWADCEPAARAFARLLLKNEVHHSGTMVRALAFHEVGGYDATLENSVDWDLWLRLASRHAVAYIPRPLYAYRMHPGQLHRSRLRAAEAQIRENLRVIDRAVVGVPGAAVLRLRAHASSHLLAVEPYALAGMPSLSLRALVSAIRADTRWSLTRPGLYRAVAVLAATVAAGRHGLIWIRQVRAIAKAFARRTGRAVRG